MKSPAVIISSAERRLGWSGRYNLVFSTSGGCH
jgi:hypothetical protein